MGQLIPYRGKQGTRRSQHDETRMDDQLILRQQNLSEIPSYRTTEDALPPPSTSRFVRTSKMRFAVSLSIREHATTVC